MGTLKEYRLHNPDVDISKLTEWPEKKRGRPPLLSEAIEKEVCADLACIANAGADITVKFCLYA